MRLFLAGVFMALVLAICFYADASRNASGTYTTPNTFVSGTVISSTNVNANFSDIATELTDSLSRSGKGGMSAALRGTDGTKAAPALSWTSETGSGLYRNGAGDVRMSVLGTDALKWTSTAIVPFLPYTGAMLDVETNTGLTSARFMPSATVPVAFVHNASVSDVAFNATHDGANYKYATSQAAFRINSDASSGVTTFQTAPSGTAGNTVTFTERQRVTASGTTFSTGIGADGSGFKHKRFGPTCTTAASAGATCTSTLTWVTTFADANYTAACTCVGASSGTPTGIISSQAAASLVFLVEATSANAAQCSAVNCIAVHD